MGDHYYVRTSVVIQNPEVCQRCIDIHEISLASSISPTDILVRYEMAAVFDPCPYPLYADVW